MRNASNMRNIKLVLAYDGTEFAGWQIQPDAPTIQGTLAQAIEKLTERKGIAARIWTDRCRRARAGTGGTFSTECSIPTENFLKALNGNLPPSIRVLEVSEVPASFHARKSGLGKLIAIACIEARFVLPFLRAMFGTILILWMSQP